jgi:hypothetical protein
MSVKRKVTVPVGKEATALFLLGVFQRVLDGLLRRHRPSLGPHCCEYFLIQHGTHCSHVSVKFEPIDTI